MPSFDTPEVPALPCGISTALPSFKIGFGLTIPFSLPSFPPSLNVHFKLSCDPTDPVSVTGGLAWGGGRESNAPPDPDDSENDPSF